MKAEPFGGCGQIFLSEVEPVSVMTDGSGHRDLVSGMDAGGGCQWLSVWAGPVSCQL